MDSGEWVVKYDWDTERHRIYAADGELIAEVGNASMGYDRQYAIALAIASMAVAIVSYDLDGGPST
jgi:hypothetical protein